MTTSDEPVSAAAVVSDTSDPSLPPAPSLWQHRPFRLYVLGEATSVAGSSVSSVAIPLLAVVELNASTSQVAFLAFLTRLPTCLVALHAGALADRHRKRPIMICSDLICAVVLVTLPLAAAFGALSLGQLMVVAVVQATAAVLHDAAAISYLPTLVDRSLIQKSNSRVGALFSVAATAGNNIGAALAAAIGAARAVTADVTSYLISAWCLWRIRVPEAGGKQQQRGPLLADIREGLGYVFRDATLRALTLTNATMSFALAVLNTVWALYLLRDLHFGSVALGVVMGTAALGSCAGALLAPRLASRYGPGPMMLGCLALTPLTQVPLLLAAPGLNWQLAIGAALAVQLFCAAAVGTTQRSIRQMIAEHRLQARMQAVSTWLTGGSRPVAALVAGGIGTWFGVRSALFAGTLLLLAPAILFGLSSIRTLRTIPQSPTAPALGARDGAAGP